MRYKFGNDHGEQLFETKDEFRVWLRERWPGNHVLHMIGSGAPSWARREVRRDATHELIGWVNFDSWVPGPEQKTLGVTMRLMEPGDLPFFYQQAAEGEMSDGTPFRIGISLADASVYLFADRPHPEDPERKQIWVLSGRALFGAMVEAVG